MERLIKLGSGAWRKKRAKRKDNTSAVTARAEPIRNRIRAVRNGSGAVVMASAGRGRVGLCSTRLVLAAKGFSRAATGTGAGRRAVQGVEVGFSDGFSGPAVSRTEASDLSWSRGFLGAGEVGGVSFSSAELAAGAEAAGFGLSVPIKAAFTLTGVNGWPFWEGPALVSGEGRGVVKALIGVF